MPGSCEPQRQPPLPGPQQPLELQTQPPPPLPQPQPLLQSQHPSEPEPQLPPRQECVLQRPLVGAAAKRMLRSALRHAELFSRSAPPPRQLGVSLGQDVWQLFRDLEEQSMGDQWAWPQVGRGVAAEQDEDMDLAWQELEHEGMESIEGGAEEDDAIVGAEIPLESPQHFCRQEAEEDSGKQHDFAGRMPPKVEDANVESSDAGPGVLTQADAGEADELGGKNQLDEDDSDDIVFLGEHWLTSPTVVFNGHGKDRIGCVMEDGRMPGVQWGEEAGYDEEDKIDEDALYLNTEGRCTSIEEADVYVAVIDPYMLDCVGIDSLDEDATIEL